jgi:hypothetical protein
MQSNGSFARKGSLCALLFAFCFVSNCAAYLDSGAGSYLFQVLAAFFIGLLFSLKRVAKAVPAILRKIIKGRDKK